jgi:predicted nuclease of predicted toxin-antitoxin system
MTFFADEGLDFLVVAALRAQGFTVYYAAELLQGAPDEAIMQMASSYGSILLTKDKDFGEMVIRSQQHTAGVVLIRIDRLNDPGKVSYVANVLAKYAAELSSHFTVIQEDKIRFRPLSF